MQVILVFVPWSKCVEEIWQSRDSQCSHWTRSISSIWKTCNKCGFPGLTPGLLNQTLVESSHLGSNKSSQSSWYMLQFNKYTGRIDTIKLSHRVTPRSATWKEEALVGKDLESFSAFSLPVLCHRHAPDVCQLGRPWFSVLHITKF